MSLVRPNAALTVDGQRLTAAEAGMLRLRVRLGMGEAHDAVELTLWPTSKLAASAAGASLTVALGDGDELTDVWTGNVAGVSGSDGSVTLDALAATAVLSRTWLSQTFLDLTIGEIVEQLAAEGGVEVDEASADVKLPAYAVDSRRAVWAHVNDLARLSGADLTTTATGALRFVAPPAAGGGLGGLAGAAAAVSDLLFGAGGLRFGANVVGWRTRRGQAPAAAAVAPYGAASEAGAEHWHWLLREPAAAGDGPVRVAAAARTREAAEAFATARSKRAERAALRSKVAVVGDPELRPGDTTTIDGLPVGGLGSVRILAVEHLLDGRGGFVSTLTVEGAE